MTLVPLKHLVRINQRALPETTDPELEFRYVDIGAVGRGVLLEQPEGMTFGEAPSRARRLVQRGDTIISTVRTYLRAVWPVEEPTSDLVVSTAFAVLTPGPEIEPRYLGWLAQADIVVEEVVTRSVGVSYPAINALEIGEIRVPWFPRRAQQLVSDFLDAETARIDALISKKRRLAQLLKERRAGHVEVAIRAMADAWGQAPLKFSVDEVTVGIVVTPAAWYSDSGVPAIRGTNVKPGRIQLEDLVYLTPEGHALHRKSSLREGDVVVVRTGEAGAAAVVPRRLDGANCIDLILVRPGRRIEPTFLEYVLNSDWTQKHIDEHSVGTIQSHFNVGAMKALPFPPAPLADQRRVVEQVSRACQQIDATTTRLNLQISLLEEHRQALITAAVTGEVGIPGTAA